MRLDKLLKIISVALILVIMALIVHAAERPYYKQYTFPTNGTYSITNEYVAGSSSGNMTIQEPQSVFLIWPAIQTTTVTVSRISSGTTVTLCKTTVTAGVQAAFELPYTVYNKTGDVFKVDAAPAPTNAGVLEVNYGD